MSEKVYTELLDGLVRLVVIPVIPLISAYLVFLLKTLIDKNKMLLTNEIEKKYLEMIEDIISKAVSFTAQTFVDTLKAQGKFDSEAAKIAFNKTKEAILSMLSDDLKNFIKTSFGDLDLWLNNAIEDLVRKNKIEKPKIEDKKE